MKTGLSIIIIMFLCFGASRSALAQEEEEKDVTTTTVRAPNGYAIRIIHSNGHSSFTPMYGEHLSGMTNFSQDPPASTGPLAGIQGRSPILLINVYATSDADGWRINVAIPKGERFNEGEQPIASYHVVENERARVKEMIELGALSFDVSVVKIMQPEATPPELVNRTNSVAVLGMVSNILPQPFKVKLHNLSPKDVLSLEIKVLGERKGSYVQFPGGSWDKPLIKAGETFELSVTSGSQAKKSDAGYEPEQIRRIQISAVVFADCSYEGHEYPAAICRAQSWGSLVQLRRLLTILDETQQLSSSSGIRSRNSVLRHIKELQTKVESLDEEADLSAVTQLRTEFPALTPYQKGNLEGACASGSRSIKVTFLKELAEFVRKFQRQSEASEFEAWLGKHIIYYTRWSETLSQQMR